MAGCFSRSAFTCGGRTASFAEPRVQWQTARCISNTACRAHQSQRIPKLKTAEDAPQELVKLLDSIRRKIFLPNALRPQQQELVYRDKHRAMLINDPITLTIGDEDFTLEPLHKQKDTPKSWKSLRQAIELMGRNENNWHGSFLALLEGFNNSEMAWKISQWERLIRWATQSRMTPLVVSAVRRADRTGLHLGNVRLARAVFWSCRSMALSGESEQWDAELTGLALRYAEQVAQLLELDKHCGGTQYSGLEKDPRIQPDCMGVILELAAMKTLISSQEGLVDKDEDGKVRTYTERLLVNLEKGIGDTMDAEEEVAIKAGRYASAADYELQRWVPVVAGLQAAKRVLGPKMPNPEYADRKISELNKRLNEREKQIKEATGQWNVEKRRGIQSLRDFENS